VFSRDWSSDVCSSDLRVTLRSSGPWGTAVPPEGRTRTGRGPIWARAYPACSRRRASSRPNTRLGPLVQRRSTGPRRPAATAPRRASSRATFSQGGPGEASTHTVQDWSRPTAGGSPFPGGGLLDDPAEVVRVPPDHRQGRRGRHLIPGELPDPG